jgi:hypothetical protein
MIAITNAEPGWYVEARDGLNVKATRVPVVLWVAVTDGRQGAGVVPFVLRDGVLVASPGGKVVDLREADSIRAQLR